MEDLAEDFRSKQETYPQATLVESILHSPDQRSTYEAIRARIFDAPVLIPSLREELSALILAGRTPYEFRARVDETASGRMYRTILRTIPQLERDELIATVQRLQALNDVIRYCPSIALPSTDSGDKDLQRGIKAIAKQAYRDKNNGYLLTIQQTLDSVESRN